ncbi:MAG TPA: ATP-binding protein [Bacteroidales bacterium]|nr:ATP-binding protein [Bacteroidales bacterium]
MISKNLYINIIIRVSLIVILSVLLGYLILKEQSLRFSIICFLTITLITINLISYLNKTNRNIRFFFDSVRNDDSNLAFPVDNKTGSLKELHLSMNRVNQQIQLLKIENRQQEQYFQKILEHLAAGIITYNNKGFVLHANTSALRLLSTEVLTHLQQIERINKKLFRAIKDLKPFERRLAAINTNQGEIQLLLKSTSFGTNENELIILSIQDIKTELDEKELESWMRLIRVLMHEIMNSITPITSLAESLSNIYRSGEEPVVAEQVTDKTIATTLQGLNVIKEQGKGLMSFVESYRKLTRIPKPDMKLFRVSELFSRVRILANSLENNKNAEISFQVINADLEIFADENLISQVLINLIKNALESNENNPDCKIKVDAGSDQSSHPEICVTDNGPGISEENLEEIFVPFFTTRENGSGIGLSVSKQIMGAHGGTLKVRSIPDKETVFCMSFQN